MSDSFLNAKMALFAQQAMQVDIIVTTALIPGKPAPKLITKGMVESMKPGSVIVDLAAEQGGNCALTEPGKVTHHKGVTIVGYTDLPSRMASMSSQLYGACVTALLADMTEEGGNLRIDLDDEVIRGSIVLQDGKMMWPPPAAPAPAAPPEPGVPTKSSASVAAAKAASAHGHDDTKGISPVLLAVAALALIGLGIVAPDSVLSHFTVFILAIFVGF